VPDWQGKRKKDGNGNGEFKAIRTTDIKLKQNVNKTISLMIG